MIQDLRVCVGSGYLVTPGTLGAGRPVPASLAILWLLESYRKEGSRGAHQDHTAGTLGGVGAESAGSGPLRGSGDCPSAPERQHDACREQRDPMLAWPGLWRASPASGSSQHGAERNDGLCWLDPHATVGEKVEESERPCLEPMRNPTQEII